MSLESLELCSYEEIKTLEDLQNFPHLTRLSVDALEEINFNLTRSMTPELEELSVKGIFLSEKELNALGELQKLETLRLADCGVTELSFLEKLPKLTGLFLERNEIRDISPIAGLGGLEILSLWENQVEDITPLAGLGALRDLDLSENRIKEIEALAGLTDLRRLELSGNRIRDISPLSGMKKMEELRLSGNLIEDYGSLSDMRELYILAVENNPGQEIGKGVFTPLLSAGKYCSVKEELLWICDARLCPEDFSRAGTKAGSGRIFGGRRGYARNLLYFRGDQRKSRPSGRRRAAPGLLYRVVERYACNTGRLCL